MARIVYANVRDSKLIGTEADLDEDQAQRLVRTGQARYVDEKPAAKKQAPELPKPGTDKP